MTESSVVPSAPSPKPSLPPPPEGIDVAYLEAFKQRVEQWCATHLGAKDGESRPSLQYNFYTTSDGNGGERFRLSLQEYVAEHHQQRNKYNITFGIKESEKPNTSYYAEAMEGILATYGVRRAMYLIQKAGEPISDAHLAEFLKERIERLKAQSPEEWVECDPDRSIRVLHGVAPHINGLAVVSLRVPSPDRLIYDVEINLRPVDHYWRCHHEYIPKSDEIILASGTDDAEQASVLVQRVESYLKENGWDCGVALPTVKNPTSRAIPLDWLKPEDMRVKWLNGAHVLELCNSTNRKQPISLVLRTQDEGEAKERAEVVMQKAILPRLASHEPISLDVLNDFMATAYPAPSITQAKKAPVDRREIFANNEMKCWLTGYELNKKNAPSGDITDHEVRINVVPSGEIARASSSLRQSVNTADAALAKQRANLMQNITEQTALDYFKKHPNQELLTQKGEVRAHGKAVAVNVFAIRRPGQGNEEGKLFFEDFRRDVLKPALDQYTRYVFFDTHTEQSADNNTHPFTLTFQAKRNKGQSAEPLAPSESVYRDTFTLSFDEEKNAQAFAKELNRRLTNQFYTKVIDPETGVETSQQDNQGFTSTHRPVRQFGQNSTDLVIRETLRGIMLDEKFKDTFQQPSRTSPLGVLQASRSVTD